MILRRNITSETTKQTFFSGQCVCIRDAKPNEAEMFGLLDAKYIIHSNGDDIMAGDDFTLRLLFGLGVIPNETETQLG